uniref:Cytosolic fatty-acid binding proteins domain-containing protein n=1 Tax=Strongyloides stercoralis TaxID=6248 RepID=A0A0K0ERR1_STRER
MEGKIKEPLNIDFYTDDNNTSTAIELSSQYSMSTFGQEFHPYFRTEYYRSSATHRIKELYNIVMAGENDSNKNLNFAKIIQSEDQTKVTVVISEFSRAYHVVKPNGDWIFLERSNDGKYNTMYIMDKEKNGDYVKVIST